MPDAILAEELKHRDWLDLLIVTVSLNGHQERRPMIRHPCGAAVLPFDPVRRVAMVVRQTRFPVLRAGCPMLTEAISGVADLDDFAGTALREAEEEAGLRLRAIERVGSVMMTPTSSTERDQLFLAEYTLADRIGIGGGLADENEQLEAFERPLDALWTEVVDADLADAKTFMLMQALRLRRPELF